MSCGEIYCCRRAQIEEAATLPTLPRYRYLN